MRIKKLNYAPQASQPLGVKSNLLKSIIQAENLANAFGLAP